MVNTFCVLILLFVVFRQSYGGKDIEDRDIILTSGHAYGDASQFYGILSSSKDSLRKMSFQRNERIFYSCDIDVRRNMIYLYDARHRSIVVGNNFDISMDNNHTSFTDEHYVYSEQHVKIAVDWVSHNTYWTDPISGVILMQPGSQYKDRSLYKIIVQEHLDRPSGIALDPLSGYLFWTDTSRTSYRIERSSLTGQNRTAIMVSSMIRIYALTVDVTNKLIYFTKLNHIESIDYNGHDRKHVFNIPKSEFYDVALFQDVVIATDYDGKFHNNSYLDVPTPDSLISANGICVYDIDQQPLPEQDRCASAGCEDICVNEPDQATCLCRTGFELHQNGKNCTEAAGEYHRALLTNNGSHLCLLSMHVIPYDSSHTMHCFYNRSKEEISYIDVNMARREVYYVRQNSIFRIPIDTRYAEEIKIVENENKCNSITGLSYDWVNYDLYWSQTSPEGIFAINVDTNDLRKVTHDNTTSSPREIIVVPHAQKLFWIADIRNKSTLFVGNLDGESESIQVLNIRQDLQTPIRLYHNVKYELLAILKQSEVSYDVLFINYKGAVRQDFAMSETTGVCALYGDLILFVTVNNANVTVLYVRDVLIDIQSPATTAVFEGLGPVKSVKMIDLDVLQPKYPSPCGEIESAGCSQICVAHGDKAQCLCEIGFTPLEDNKTCSSLPLEDNFILAADYKHGNLFQLALNNSDEVHGIQTGKTRRLQSILYNPTKQEVVWVQYGEAQVFTTSLDGKKEQRIAEMGVLRGFPFKFTLDITTGNIYFTGARGKPSQIENKQFVYIIGVISTSGDVNIIYEGNNAYAMGIVLHPGKGLMFWSDQFRIMRAGMDGSDVKIIVAGDRHYHSLAIDYFEERLYWYEYSEGIIYRSDLDGNHVTEIYTVAGGARVQVELKLLGDYLYYAGHAFVYVARLNKRNASDITVFGKHAGIGTIEDFDVYSSNESLLAPQNKVCSDNNGNCSHICLPNSIGGRTCACRYGVSLQTDNKTCDAQATNVTAVQEPVKTELNRRVTDSLLVVYGSVAAVVCTVLVVYLLICLIRRKKTRTWANVSPSTTATQTLLSSPPVQNLGLCEDGHCTATKSSAIDTANDQTVQHTTDAMSADSHLWEQYADQSNVSRRTPQISKHGLEYMKEGNQDTTGTNVHNLCDRHAVLCSRKLLSQSVDALSQNRNGYIFEKRDTLQEKGDTSGLNLYKTHSHAAAAEKMHRNKVQNFSLSHCDQYGHGPQQKCINKCNCPKEATQNMAQLTEEIREQLAAINDSDDDSVSRNNSLS